MLDPTPSPTNALPTPPRARAHHHRPAPVSLHTWLPSHPPLGPSRSPRRPRPSSVPSSAGSHTSSRLSRQRCSRCAMGLATAPRSRGSRSPRAATCPKSRRSSHRAALFASYGSSDPSGSFRLFATMRNGSIRVACRLARATARAERRQQRQRRPRPEPRAKGREAEGGTHAGWSPRSCSRRRTTS